MLDHPFDNDEIMTVETTAVPTAPTPKVTATLNGSSALAKELPLLTLEDIQAKELSYIGGNAPAENRKMFDGILANYMAARVIQKDDSWYTIGKALSYMVQRDIHVTLGYPSIEGWMKDSLRKVLRDTYGNKKSVTALLQYRNYYDLECRLADFSTEAVVNWQEAMPGVSDYRLLNSMTSNPKTFLPGVVIDTTEELKEELVKIAAEVIGSISMEKPDPEGDFPKGKDSPPDDPRSWCGDRHRDRRVGRSFFNQGEPLLRDAW
jgi:hypothetical protein